MRKLTETYIGSKTEAKIFIQDKFPEATIFTEEEDWCSWEHPLCNKGLPFAVYNCEQPEVLEILYCNFRKDN